MITQIDPKTALVVIDLQKGIVNLPLVHPVEAIINNSIKLIRAFRSKNLPVVIVKVNPLGASWTQTRVDEPSAPKSEDQIIQARTTMQLAGFFDIVPELETRPDDIFITKTTWGAFYHTELHELLKRLHITGIVLAGIATSIGVEGTARQASELGYNLSFANDAITDMHSSAHEHSITKIFPRIGEVGDTIAIIEKVNALMP
ncbi:isochorismatase family protein [Mucilaginibacter paludis]|uniref:Isochorismatase hydrolase n=1 Tax=Mucilaginibacter paludis DSM 18603 TaxID=714943 RepID=H1Y699_9SPHI|nr:isochorismatase family protein [Mucilaginibacter paludis]EHQ24847.1 isochorismatase hydrolase [Mucilaginibacter paludis DSM 18603]